MTPSSTRRERVRAATVDEIKATAFRLLDDEGPQGVTLRAIAREMGMTAPGLYRYFPSHEELWECLCHQTYDEVADALAEAAAAAAELDAAGRLIVISRRFRSWAAEHPRQFGLVFGMPLPGLREMKDLTSPEHLSGMRFALVFTEAFAQLWQERPFPVPADEEIPADLIRQLAAFRAQIASVLPATAEQPVGAILLFLQSWVQLYGVVTMEVFGHLGFCLDDASSFFESQLAAIGRRLGIDKLPTATPAA